MTKDQEVLKLKEKDAVEYLVSNPESRICTKQAYYQYKNGRTNFKVIKFVGGVETEITLHVYEGVPAKIKAPKKSKHNIS